MRRAAGAALALALILAPAFGAHAARAAAVGRATAGFPPVVGQALAALAPRIGRLPLGAPTVLPLEPPSHTFLTAITRVTARGWSVAVLRADQAYAVDNPAITAPGAHAVAVVRFGVAVLAAPLPPPGSAALPPALWRAGLRARGLSPAGQTDALPSGGASATVALGGGISASAYRIGPETETLVWHEGDWTLSVADTTPTTALAVAAALVRYLHAAFLPPDPGLVTVAVGVHGVYTRVDWSVGAMLYFADNNLRAGDNPVGACAMAVSWHSA